MCICLYMQSFCQIPAFEDGDVKFFGNQWLHNTRTNTKLGLVNNSNLTTYHQNRIRTIFGNRSDLKLQLNLSRQPSINVINNVITDQMSSLWWDFLFFQDLVPVSIRFRVSLQKRISVVSLLSSFTNLLRDTVLPGSHLKKGSPAVFFAVLIHQSVSNCSSG
ncbi:hypothetical protein L1987_81925 [Smallanthus sonchifolius]|uniref:Uncharacterized protein n=1 Tax=Smallanthus sonchifolius TaxID=185202 RepID=A0ACB8YT10_9ASTR|nr:hypothetical protein L1987_81925 [Smallanthus sonchifolius]